MGMIKEVKEKIVSKKNKKDKFEAKSKLSLVILIVDKFQEEAIKNIMIKNKCSAVFVKHGYGCADPSIYETLYLVEKTKSIMFALINDDDYEELKEELLKRLHYSDYTKGIIMKVDISSIIGKSLYNFFSHNEYMKEVE